ncbi:MAG: sensor histidine kinase, partial [Nocardioides sp.]
ESGGAEWRIEPVDLSQALTTSAQATAQLFRDRGVALEVQVPDPAPVVRADPDRVVQVLLNLLSNAVKFCPTGSGRVRVVVDTRDGVVRVDVGDNGPGIADEDRDVIFDKFRQGGNTQTNRPSGTGLGLPISRQIVDHLGGRLWVESTPGRGATFSFELPVAAVGSVPAPTEREGR